MAPPCDHAGTCGFRLIPDDELVELAGTYFETWGWQIRLLARRHTQR